jgi:HEAT repeat protein
MRLSGWRCGACASAALVLACLCFGCAAFRSPKTLMDRARNAPTLSQRRQALTELRGRVDPSMRADLEAVMARELDPASRAIAADLLGEIGDPASAPELRQSARADTSWAVRKRALEALAKVQGAKSADDLRYALANDPDPEVRQEAVLLAAHNLPAAQAQPLLLDALSDRADVVRLQADAMLSRLTGLSAAPNAGSWKAALQAAGKP